MIGQITAFDSDQGLNGQVNYSIVNSNPNDHLNTQNNNNINKYFNLDSVTGLLTLRMALDYEDKQMFSFSIEARDGGIGK